MVNQYTERDVYIAELIEDLARNFKDDGRGISWVGCSYRTGQGTTESLPLNGINPKSGDFILKGLELIEDVRLVSTYLGQFSPHQLVKVIGQIEATALSPLVWDRPTEWHERRAVARLVKRNEPLGVEYERLAHFARALGGTYVPGKEAVSGATG